VSISRTAVHNDCLVQWLKAKPSSELECSICRAPYKVSKEKMTMADMRKLACTVLTLVVMLIGVGCMAWVKLKRAMWLAGRYNRATPSLHMTSLPY
jgi:E3 ubiquitin-protein ligase DOA10